MASLSSNSGRRRRADENRDQQSNLDTLKLARPRNFNIQDGPLKQTLSCGLIVRRNIEDHGFVVRLDSRSDNSGTFIEIDMNDYVSIKRKFLEHVEQVGPIYKSVNVSVSVVSAAASGSNGQPIVKFYQKGSTISMKPAAFDIMMSFGDELWKEYADFKEIKAGDQSFQEDIRNLVAFVRNEKKINDWMVPPPEWYKEGARALTTWGNFTGQVSKSKNKTITTQTTRNQQAQQLWDEKSIVLLDSSVVLNGCYQLAQSKAFLIDDGNPAEPKNWQIICCGTKVHERPEESQFFVRIHDARADNTVRKFIEMDILEFKFIKSLERDVKQHIKNRVRDDTTIYANKEFSLVFYPRNHEREYAEPAVKFSRPSTQISMKIKAFTTMMSLDGVIGKEYAAFKSRNQEDQQFLDETTVAMIYNRNHEREYAGMGELPEWYKTGARTSWKNLMSQVSQSKERIRKKARMSDNNSA